MDDTRDERGQFKRGASGNPAGRPVGAGRIGQLRRMLDESAEGVLHVVHKAASEGDLVACRILLDRTVPVIRAVGFTQPMDLPAGSLSEQGKAVLALVASGELGVGEAAEMLAAMTSLAKIVEADSVEQRIAALERRIATGNNDDDY